jgi:co-chaperonin GroES (HSP10)
MNPVYKCLGRFFRGQGWCCALFLLLGAVAGAQAAPTKVLGTVKAISGTSIVLTTDSGSETTVTLADSTRVLKVLPGQSIKQATTIQASEIKVGDRILAAGDSGEANAIVASTVVVMTQGDIADKQQQEREEWRRGVGGIVKEANVAAETITISNALASAGKPVLIHVSPATIIKRYSPNSVKFDDAKPGTLDEVKPGDQLRARGQKNADGTEFTAQAIVSGTFREVAGTVISSDAGAGSLTVMDLIAKKPVTFKVTADSQMRKLPQFVAQRLAMRLKGGVPAGGSPNGAPTEVAKGGGAGGGERGQGQGSQGNWRGTGGYGGPGAGGGFGAGGGSPDFQQILSRMPAVALSDLQKGDAVMLVATEGTTNSAPTTITLLAGVEPILTATPGGAAAATILSPWNLGASPGGDAASQ